MTIRTATQHDRDAIHRVHWSAFSEEERDMVSQLAVNLLFEETSPKIISLVAELEGSVVGHVAFSPVTLENNKHFQGFILGPLGVVPNCQNRGLGTRLIESGMEQLSSMGTDMLFVYGDPKYYGRFGFRAEAAEHYRPPYRLEYPFGWQAITLNAYKASAIPSKIAVVSSLMNAALW